MQSEEMQAWARESLAQTTAEQDIQEFVQSGPMPEEEAQVFGVGALSEAIDGVAAEFEQVEVDDASELSEGEGEEIAASDIDEL